MAIRVPTGMQTVTATVSRKSFIQYQCCKCGKPVLYEYKLSQQGSGSYHIFQSSATQQKVENNAAAKATQLLDRQDDIMFSAINRDHNYECVTQKVVCPHCGEKQPWSGFPCPWKQTKYFRLWVVGLVIFSFYTLLMSSAASEIGIDAVAYFAISPAFLALLPCFRYFRRRKARRRIQNADFTPPVYYNRDNFFELIQQVNANDDPQGTENT